MSKRNFLIVPFVLGISSISACSAEEVEIQNKMLVLDQKQCLVRYKNKEAPLELDGQCHFVKAPNSKSIHKQFYNDLNAHVIVVVGANVKNNPDFPITRQRSDCGNRVQAVIVSGEGRITLSKPVASSVTCAGVGMDEKEFWMLAHQ